MVCYLMELLFDGDGGRGRGSLLELNSTFQTLSVVDQITTNTANVIEDDVGRWCFSLLAELDLLDSRLSASRMDIKIAVV